MNRRQSIIVGVGLVITLALFVFPPWVFEYHPLDAGNGEYYDIQFSYILVPPGESSGQAVRQVSDFIDEHEQWQENEQEHDENALADLIRLLRATDPLGALNSLLDDLHLERYPTLRGKTFRLKVGQAADERELALVE